jgi:hypothetical protein
MDRPPPCPGDVPSRFVEGAVEGIGVLIAEQVGTIVT